MRKTIFKIGVMVGVFILTVFISNILLNRGTTDMTADMSPASLPIIYMNVNDVYVNPVHGYTVSMDGNYLRGPITPLLANRSLSFKAQLYDSVIAKVGYEVRPLDMSRLIEDTELANFSYDNNEIYATITLKDLIEDDTEYMLIIKLTTSSGNVIRYYVRVINRAELYIDEKIAFVQEFSRKTFNRDTAIDLKQYMESNAEGDNSSYGYVNIHSSMNQLSWGGLNPELKSNKQIYILEIDNDSASVRLDYQVEIMSELHNVSEFFRVMKGKERMYLMDYERIMDQVFDEEKNVVVNGKILHGIIEENPVRIENENGSIYAFVQQNALYAYDMGSNTMARLFSFHDKKNSDERTYYNAHAIKPLDIDGVGNIRFIVYGYMNRGIHEGQVGVVLYYYDAALNTIEEELFIPYSKSYQVLKKEIASLSYINPKGVFFILLDGTIYNININTRAIRTIQDSISETNFFSSDDRSMIAWQTGNNVSEYDEILIYRLDDMDPTIIKATPGDIVIPLGYMDRDLIYGTAKKSDVTVDEAGRTVIPMYNVKIQDESGNILKRYEQDGIYISNISIQDNMIVLSRMVKNYEDGGFDAIEDDQIMSNKSETKMKNILTSVVTEDTETTYQTKLYKEPASGNLKLTNPKEIVYEGSRDIIPNVNDSLVRYYVYAGGELKNIYIDASEAVNEAEEVNGVVVDRNMAYIWESANRLKSTRIANLSLEEDKHPKNDTDEEPEEGQENENTKTISSYAECLDIMLKSQGVYKDTYAQLREKSVINVLRDNLDCNVLELSGCDLSAVLYYVSRGYPVMAMTGGGHSVLIVGYDSKNTILYDPIKESTYKMGMQDSKLFFEQNGNQFVSFVK